MDFSFSEEQNLLRDSVRKFVEKDYDFEKRRALMKTDLGFSRELWRSYAELGWTALPFAEADGGLAGSAVDTMIVLEELGKGLTLEPYLPTVIFAGGLLRRAAQPLRARYVPGIINGETLAAVAYAEADSRFDLNIVATTAKRDGSGFVLNGKKISVVAGPSADLLIVSARTAGGAQDKAGITLFAIDAKASGVSRKDYRTVDGLRGSDVTLSQVKVGEDAVVGQVDQGFALLEAVADEALIALGAEAMGVMEVLFKSTLAYIKERKQFGVAIGTFQALQHRMVDVFVEYEQFKSMVYMASMMQDAAKSGATNQDAAKSGATNQDAAKSGATNQDAAKSGATNQDAAKSGATNQDAAKSGATNQDAAKGGGVSQAAAALKVQLGKSGRVVGQQAIQLHGGMGMTDELAVSHFFKRLTIIDLMLGNADYHLGRYVAQSV